MGYGLSDARGHVNARGARGMGTCSRCRQRPAILRVHLEPGVDVYWCGSCIVALRDKEAR